MYEKLIDKSHLNASIFSRVLGFLGVLRGYVRVLLMIFENFSIFNLKVLQKSSKFCQNFHFIPLNPKKSHYYPSPSDLSTSSMTTHVLCIIGSFVRKTKNIDEKYMKKTQKNI